MLYINIYYYAYLHIEIITSVRLSAARETRTRSRFYLSHDLTYCCAFSTHRTYTTRSQAHIRAAQMHTLCAPICALGKLTKIQRLASEQPDDRRDDDRHAFNVYDVLCYVVLCVSFGREYNVICITSRPAAVQFWRYYVAMWRRL